MMSHDVIHDVIIGKLHQEPPTITLILMAYTHSTPPNKDHSFLLFLQVYHKAFSLSLQYYPPFL